MYNQQQYGYGQGQGQGQGGFQQQPQQTGMGGMGMGGNTGYLNSQPTGYGMPQQQQQQQPMATGFQPQQQQQRPGQNNTGGQGNFAFLNQPPRPSFNGASNGGLVSQMTGFTAGGASGLMPMHTGMMSQPTGMGMGMMPQQTGMGMGLMAQPTGMGMGMGGGLRPQPTGVHDPRLQQMMQSFMPSNMSQPFDPSGQAQFNNTAQPLQQSFQSLLDNPKVRTPKVPWTLSKQEKKDYDQIFRAWDVQGDGFITGPAAIEVFGQSGLSQDDLMKIWNLSDGTNRGSLNVAEFHVAMGLIYRALNGNDIPDELPEELVPASSKDIDTTVNFMRDLLKHETSTRSNASSPSYDPRLSASNSKDASAYKHSDEGTGTAYKPSSRHLDRKSVRYAGEDPDAGLNDIRRRLESTSAMLDKSANDSANRDAEDEALEEELDDLKVQVVRLQDDIERVNKGRRSVDNDEKRRKYERELLFLMHEKLPELERKKKQREEDRRMEERAGVRARDKRNDTHGRYGRDRDEGGDKDWLKGTYDRERRDSRDRDRDYRRDDRDRERDRDYDRSSRDRSRERERDREYRPRSPAPSTRDRAPPPAPKDISADDQPTPRAPPAPTTTKAAAPSTAKMTPEERSAFIREQAQKRIQDRLRALGVQTSEPEQAQPVVDNSVQERLERERKEAEEKSRTAEKEQQAREESRQKRLVGGAGGGEEKKEVPPSSAVPAQAPVKSAMKKPAAPPPAPVSRSKQPPAPPVSKSSAAPGPVPKPPVKEVQQEEEEDPEEVELRQREEKRQKAAADRKARMAQLEKEEEEERVKEEEMIAKRKAAKAASAQPQSQSQPAAESVPAVGGGGGYNPFRKPSTAAAAATSPASSAVTSPTPAPAPSTGGAGFNPFFRPPAAAAASSTPPTSAPSAPAPPPPPPPPAPPAPAPAPAPAPVAQQQPRSAPKPAEDEWEQIQEKDEDSDDSSDDDYATSRQQRNKLASALFGGILPTAVTNMLPASIRPDTGSPAPGSGSNTPTTARSNPEALKKLGGGVPEPGSGGMGALFASIQGGARLKKAQTVEKAGVSGRVVGDAAPPAHINAQPRAVSPPPPPASARTEQRDEPRTDSREQSGETEPRDESHGVNKRQSVDWYAGLAADQSHPAQNYEQTLGTTREEDESEAAAGADGDGMDEFDMTREIRVRSLYSYDGQREVDLSFAENVVITAHPAKDASSPWWYGTVVKSGEKGWFPHTYAEEMESTKARALFSYEGGEADQLPFLEGDTLTIVDRSEDDWWKTEKAGVIFLVPASYLEVVQGDGTDSRTQALPPPALAQHTSPAPPKTERGASTGDAGLPDITHAPSPLPPAPVPSNHDQDLLAPTPLPAAAIPAVSRLRSGTVSSVASAASAKSAGSTDDEGSSSGDDSVLSWWSSDDADSEDEERETERKRREETRQKILETAGLILRREPPGSTPASTKATKPRRPAPAAPAAGRGGGGGGGGGAKLKARKSRRKAPGVPLKRPESGVSSDSREPEVEVQDAYAKYEQYLHQAQTKSRRPRANTTTQRPASTASDLGLPVPVSPTPTAGSAGQGGGGGGKITGFFSRMMAPSASHDSASGSTPGRKVISGPIRRGDEGEASAEEDGEMGKTWSSLVDPSVLETMSTRERKRQEAIFEFIATESTYNRDLQLIVNVYYASLLQSFPEMDEKALTVIFANIEDILLFNTGFLSSLEERQKSCRLYVDVIGDILAENAGGMGVYETWCVNQKGAEGVLRSLRGGDEGLRRHLENIRDNNPEVRGLDLSSFLLIPMQRITRYPLLLRQIVHYTEPDQDLALVTSALRTIESIVGNINESVREAENEDRLRVLSEDLWVGGEGRIDLTAPTQYQGPRRLIKEGGVSKAKSGKKLQLVLCNDILILIESRNLYRMPIPLFELAVKEGRDAAFAVKVDRHRGGDTIALRAGSAKEAKEWVGLIESARRGVIERRKLVEPRMREGY